jgi:hypothetical protein
MRKFSQILERKSNIDLFSRLGVTEEEITDVFVNLTDEEYTIGYKTIFITPSGNEYYDTAGVPDYYPTLEITADRDLSESSKETLNWNGSIYLENDINLLKLIYNTISRLKSMFPSTVSIYYSMRSLNHIELRVMFGIETGKDIVDYEKLKSAIEKLTDDEELMGNYMLQRTTSYSNTQNIEIRVPKQNNNFNINQEPKSDVDRIIMQIIKENRSDNKNQLLDIFKAYVTRFFAIANNENISLRGGKLKMNGLDSDPIVFTNTETNEAVVKITYDYELHAEHARVMTKKGVFKNEYKTFNVYMLEFKITLIDSDED